MTDPNIKQPPHSNEAEQSLLGAVMIAGIGPVAAMLQESDFYREVHRLTWRACMELDAANERIDVVSVADWFSRAGKSEMVEHGAYLTGLANETPGSAGMKTWAKVIREKAMLRDLIALSVDIGDRALSEERPEPIVMDLQEQLHVFAGATQSNSPKTITQVAGSWLESLQAHMEVEPCRTGLADLDKIVLGLFPGDLIIEAGRPGMGKTALAVQIAEYIGRTMPVMIFSREMSNEQIYGRMAMAGIPPEKQRSPKDLTDEDWTQIRQRMQALKGSKLLFDDVSNTMQYMAARARRQHQRQKLGLIVVDYIQLIDPPRAENRTQEVSQISRALKMLAKSLGVPILALSQLNREVDGRADKRPIMKDLRESGSLEQDADQIWFIYRHSHYHPDFDSDIAEISVPKHRAAVPGIARVLWQANRTRFVNADWDLIEDYKQLIKPKTEKRETSNFKTMAGGYR